MKFFYTLTIVILAWACQPTKAPFATMTAEEGGYAYEYVVDDPMSTRIYTLKNGLKVYLSDYEKAPRVHIFIPVKAGGKNDPADNTGLAHYLEHMMFKGTGSFGTLNYQEEKMMLDSIEQMFNYYATLTDDEERKSYYQKIDAYSNEAAKYAIPNEYDKMIAMLGGKGLNAYTTDDRTVYTVDMPANELPRFLAVEGNRFRQIVNRLFHTELEAVYEEKNRSLDNDYWKVYETMAKGIFEKHPYGTQTVIGTIEHLKNPSITEIKNYFETYYRPNNVAICISGDIDYTETIRLIEQNFGDWEPNDQLPVWEKVEEEPIAAPVVKEVFGPDAEFLNLGFRFDGTGSEDYIMVKLIDMILNNAEAGLIDLNLKQKQEVLNAGSYVNDMNDYSVHVIYGNAKQNQSLEEVRDLILEQIELVKKGEFEDWLLDAVITDFKKSAMSGLENNWSRANDMVMAFTNDMEWADYIQQIDKMEKVTKEQLVAFANEKYGDNYVAVFKRTGEDPNKQKVEKPEITKVPLNRDDKSEFHQEIADMAVDKLKPVFVDYQADINAFEVSEVGVLAKENDENELFDLTYMLDFGKNADPKLAIAVQYLEFLGTEEYTAEEFKKELYKIGCSFSVFASTERTYVTLSGLDENMEKATKLFESLLANPVADQEALDKMVDRMFKSRADAKKNKGTILWSGLYNYGIYGESNPFNDVLSNSQLAQLEGEELVAIIKGITTFPHRILYYGPRPQAEVETFLASYHPVPETFESIPEVKKYEEQPIEQPNVYWADYDMVQTEIIFLSKSVEYNPENAPSVRMFNQYFGGGMNSIVFQEIREAQGLAYSVFSSYSEARTQDRSNYLYAYIGTQADKQSEAMDAMVDLINDMPASQEAFDIAKLAILNKIESERVTGSSVIWNYISAQDRGLDYDVRSDIYQDVQNMTFENLQSFHEKYIKDNTYVTVLVGARDKIDFEALKSYGNIKELSLDQLFGYEDSEVIESM
ncbi:MAG: M16 family metallopeptidase [Cyclobacteriaceae bacterium]